MSSLLSSRRHQVMAIGLVAITGLMSGVLVARTDESAIPPVQAGQAQEGPLDPRLEVIQRFEDGSHVFATYWRNDDELWYVSSAPDGGLNLHRYSLSAGSAAVWSVPIKAVQTTYTFLAEDGDGTLWLAANYSVASFDPKTEQFTASYEVDRRPSEVDPAAVAREHFDGSWINALVAQSDGHVLIARHNVKALYRLERVSPALEVKLDQAPTGLISVGGRAVPVVHKGDAMYVVGSSERFTLPPLGESGCALREAAPGDGAALEADGDPIALGVRIAPTDPIVADDERMRVAMGVAYDGAVLVADCSRKGVSSYSLGSTIEYVDGIILGADTSAPRRNLHFAEAVAVSGNGTIAVSISTGEVAVGR
jgi:hypothetical protein